MGNRRAEFPFGTSNNHREKKGGKAGDGYLEEIILCEPQCWGFEHVPFNAALLKTAVLAFPEAHITFVGEKKHIESVRSLLSRYAPCPASSIAWQPVSIPPRQAGGWWRLNQELLWARSVLRLATERKALVLIVTSIANTGLLTLKRLLRRRSRLVPALVIPHSILSSLEGPQFRRPWNWLISMQQVLRWRHPSGLRYISLGASIHQCIKQGYPRLARHFRPLDHPYLWAKNSEALVPWSESPKVLRFGYFGAGYRSKGFETFRRLACRSREGHPQAEFVLVGFVPKMEKRYSASDETCIQGLSHEPLTQEEYGSRATSLTYAAMPLDPKSYRLSASASFLDALSFVKPGIYIRNPYVEYYFERMGDIGYLCDSYEEMRDILFSILAEFPGPRYRRQQENILKGRRIFEPETLAPKLREIIEDLQGSLTSLGSGRNPKSREEARLDP